MTGQAVTVLLSDGDLLLLDPLAPELEDLPTALADEMVVVSMLSLVDSDIVPEVNCTCDPGFAEESERAIDRCSTDLGMLFSHPFVKTLTGDVTIDKQKRAQDRVALARALEGVTGEISRQLLPIPLEFSVERPHYTQDTRSLLGVLTRLDPPLYKEAAHGKADVGILGQSGTDEELVEPFAYIASSHTELHLTRQGLGLLHL